MTDMPIGELTLDKKSVLRIEKTVAEACLKMTCIVTCDPSDKDLAVFSGVFFQNRGHYYVLTAKHCLEDIQKPKTIGLSNYGAQTLNAEFEWRQDFEVKNDLVKAEIDIAAIELSPDYAVRLNAEWVSRDRIAGDITVGAPVFAVGFPKEILRRNPVDKRIIYPGPYAAFSVVVDPPRSESMLNPVDTAVDFFIYFEELKGTGNNDQQGHLRGMSGGGMFTFDTISFKTEELWTPNIKLLGILSALFQGKFIRGKKAGLILPAIEQMIRGALGKGNEKVCITRRWSQSAREPIGNKRCCLWLSFSLRRSELGASPLCHSLK